MQTWEIIVTIDVLQRWPGLHGRPVVLHGYVKTPTHRQQVTGVTRDGEHSPGVNALILLFCLPMIAI